MVQHRGGVQINGPVHEVKEENEMDLPSHQE